MRRRFRSMIVWAALLGFVAAPAMAATARQTVEQQVRKILSRLQDPVFKGQAREEKIRQIQEIINQVFDYTELSKRTLGKDWKSFSAAQQTEFTARFGKLLEKVYADRILAYTSEKIEFGNEVDLREGQVEIKSAIITADNRQIPLDYRLILKDGEWRVYDLVIEGISLVQNYRSQFREILAKQTPEEVIRFLKEKSQ